MVGEPKYPPEQIYYILDNVLKKTKNDALSQGFQQVFGKTLTPTQIRYIKNKYGKDPDYNSPMINRRLQYRGPGQLKFPYGAHESEVGGLVYSSTAPSSSAQISTAGSSSQANIGMVARTQMPSAGTSIQASAGLSSRTPVPLPGSSVPASARTHIPMTQLPPSHPASIPIMSIEQPFPPSSSHPERFVFSGQYSPPGPSDQHTSGMIFASPSQGSLDTPLMFSATATDPFLPGVELRSSPGPITVNESSVITPLQSSRSDFGGSSITKRNAEALDASPSSPPAAKRIKTEPTSRPILTTPSQSQDQRMSITRQGQNVNFPITYETFNTNLQSPNMSRLIPAPSMYTIPFYHPDAAMRTYNTFPSWNPYITMRQTPIIVDPMLRNTTPTLSSFRGTPIVHHNQLHTTAAASPEPILPHMVPLPDDDSTSVLFDPAQQRMSSTPHQALHQVACPSVPQLHECSINPANLIKSPQPLIKQEQNESPRESSDGVTGLTAVVSSPRPDKEGSGPPLEEDPQLDRLLERDRCEPGLEDQGRILLPPEELLDIGRESEDLFGVDDFLFNLEPLVWATQAESPEADQADE